MCITEQRIKVTEKYTSVNIFEQEFLKVCVLLDYTVKLNLWLQYLSWKLFPAAKLRSFPGEDQVLVFFLIYQKIRLRSLQLTLGVLSSLDNVSLDVNVSS